MATTAKETRLATPVGAPAGLAPGQGDVANELVARARALRPRVREEAAATEKRGCYSPALHEAFRRAGFYRILQPRRFGGLELDLPTFFRVMVEISAGDPGTGWCLCLGSGHALQAASYFDADAQERIFGPEGHFVAPFGGSGAGPDCQATPVPGGYRVSGTWRYCSGAPYSTHFMGFARLNAPGAEGEPSTVIIVVPRAQYRVLDDWGDILGLRGSGSNSVVVDGALIPENFVADQRFVESTNGGTPGLALHGNPMYGGPMLGFSVGELACSQVGAAKAALEEYERIIRHSSPIFDRSVRKYEHHDWQRIFGLARSAVLSAEALLIHTGEQFMQFCREAAAGGAPFDLARAYQLLGMQHQVCRLAWDAGLDLYRAASSSNARDGELMQRLFRDLATFKSNGVHQPDFLAAELARAYFDLPRGRSV